MSIADSFRFQLLDVGKRFIYAIDGVAPCLDRLTGKATAKTVFVPDIGYPVEFGSGTRAVTGWFVASRGTPVASVLLLHGIGDRAYYWRRAQERLAEAGISSLIFDLAGYGGNHGSTTPANMEADARAAYGLLVGKASPRTPILLLGFSLGSGLAAQVAGKLTPRPAGLVLSEAFTTLREAAKRAARPASILGYMLPNLWKTRENVAHLGLPLLLIHSSGDKLFPVSMAEDLLAAARRGGTEAELRILHGYGHDAPYRLVPEDYWATVIAFITRVTSARKA